MHENLANGYRGFIEATEKMDGDMELLDGSRTTAVEWAKEKGRRSW